MRCRARRCYHPQLSLRGAKRRRNLHRGALGQSCASRWRLLRRFAPRNDTLRSLTFSPHTACTDRPRRSAAPGRTGSPSRNCRMAHLRSSSMPKMHGCRSTMRCWIAAYMRHALRLVGLEPRLHHHVVQLGIMQMVHAPELALGGGGVLRGDDIRIGADRRDIDRYHIGRGLRLGTARHQRRPGLRHHVHLDVQWLQRIPAPPGRSAVPLPGRRRRDTSSSIPPFGVLRLRQVLPRHVQIAARHVGDRDMAGHRIRERDCPSASPRCSRSAAARRSRTHRPSPCGS